MAGEKGRRFEHPTGKGENMEVRKAVIETSVTGGGKSIEGEGRKAREAAGRKSTNP